MVDPRTSRDALILLLNHETQREVDSWEPMRLAKAAELMTTQKALREEITNKATEWFQRITGQ